MDERKREPASRIEDEKFQFRRTVTKCVKYYRQSNEHRHGLNQWQPMYMIEEKANESSQAEYGGEENLSTKNTGQSFQGSAIRRRAPRIRKQDEQGLNYSERNHDPEGERGALVSPKPKRSGSNGNQ